MFKRGFEKTAFKKISGLRREEELMAYNDRTSRIFNNFTKNV